MPALARYWPLAAALAITLMASALRLGPLAESLWIDELHTAWCALGPLSDVAPRAALGNQSPPYFWFQWVFVTILGPGEFTLRLPSLLAGSLLPLAIFLLARRRQVEFAGLIAAALIAIDPHSIYYATEARPYALLQLLAVIHIGLTMEVAQQPTRTLRITWVLLAAFIFYLHYTAALLIAAEAIFMAYRSASFRLFTSLLLDLAILSLLCLPALGNLQSIFAHRANWAAFIKPQPLSNAIDWTPLPAWWWLVLVVVALVGTRLKEKASTRVRTVPLVICWLAVPIAIAWISTQTDFARLFFPRYLVAALPAAALLAGLCASASPRSWQRLAIGLLTIAIAIHSTGLLPRLHSTGLAIAPRREDWRGCIAWLNGNLPQSQYPVLVWSGLIEAGALRQPHHELLEEYCLLSVTSLYPLDIDPTDIFPLPINDPGRLDQVVEMLIVHRGGLWLIVRGEKKTSAQIAKAILASLQKTSPPESGAKWQIRDQKSFGRVHALRLATAAHP